VNLEARKSWDFVEFTFQVWDCGLDPFDWFDHNDGGAFSPGFEGNITISQSG
jgi:hypothetical protein